MNGYEESKATFTCRGNGADIPSGISTTEYSGKKVEEIGTNLIHMLQKLIRGADF